MDKRLTEPTTGSFKYELKDHKTVAGEGGVGGDIARWILHFLACK